MAHQPPATAYFRAPEAPQRSHKNRSYWYPSYTYRCIHITMHMHMHGMFASILILHYGNQCARPPVPPKARKNPLDLQPPTQQLNKSRSTSISRYGVIVHVHNMSCLSSKSLHFWSRPPTQLAEVPLLAEAPGPEASHRWRTSAKADRSVQSQGEGDGTGGRERGEREGRGERSGKMAFFRAT